MLKYLCQPFFAGCLWFCATAAPLQAAPNQEVLMATIQSGASLQEKWTAAHQLAGIATAEAVPKLAGFLADEQLNDLARYVLEPLPSPSVDGALRAALSTAKGRALAGVITSLGVRRDAKAVAPLARYLGDTDIVVVFATLTGLGRIGTVPAAKAIEGRISSAPGKTPPQFWVGLVQCAETLRERGQRAEAFKVFQWISSAKAPAWIHAAGVRGAILTGGDESLKLLAQHLQTETSTVLRLVQSELPGPAVTAVLIAELPKLPTGRQVLVIEALGQRGDAEAIAALIRAARSGDKSVRLAAIRTVAHSDSLVLALVDLVSDADRDIAQAAQDRLASLPEAEADRAILKLLNSETPALRLAAIEMASRRRLHSATPALVKAATSQDTSLAAAALKALGELATEADLPALLALLSNPSVDAGAVERALVAVGGRAQRSESYADNIIEAFAKSTTAAKCVLLRVLGEFGGGKALQTVRAAVADSNDDVKKAAIRTLAGWHSAEAGPDLLQLAKTLTDPTDKALCLRGVLRLAASEETPVPQRLSFCQQAAPMLAGMEKKKMLLSALSGIALPEALSLAAPLLEDASVRQEASATVLAMAAALLQGQQAAAHASSLIDPLSRISQAAATPEQASQAKALLKKATDLSPKPPVSTQLKAYPFFPFCIDWHDAKKRGYVEQAAMLKELGYEGVGHIFLDGVAERLKSLDEAGLKLFQITMNVDVASGKTAYEARFKEVLALVKGRHVQFDLLLNGMLPSDVSVDLHAVDILREMSDLAQDSGAHLLLYPHQGSWVERIEDAVRVAEKVNRPNVGVMFNLCHWLRVDKQRDYKPLLVQAMPRLWAVSICGADEFDAAPGWEHYIQPLDKGSFNVGLLLKTLKELGYRGPIGLQCFGIGGDAREHLARSLSAWQKLSKNLKGAAP